MEQKGFIDWALVLAEEQARQADRQETVRSRHIELSDSAMGFVDRVARVQGVSRNEMLELMISLYRASWRSVGAVGSVAR